MFLSVKMCMCVCEVNRVYEIGPMSGWVVYVSMSGLTNDVNVV